MLVRWHESGDLEVISGVVSSALSDALGDHAYEVIITPAELRETGDWDVDNPTEEDLEAIAEMLSPGSPYL